LYTREARNNNSKEKKDSRLVRGRKEKKREKFKVNS
jgi:hypothetical protein